MFEQKLTKRLAGPWQTDYMKPLIDFSARLYYLLLVMETHVMLMCGGGRVVGRCGRRGNISCGRAAGSGEGCQNLIPSRTTAHASTTILFCCLLSTVGSS